MSEKPPENLENDSAPKSPASDLSPEVLEKVMAKVQDINKKGIAYSIVLRGKQNDINFENVLKIGIQGLPKRNECVYFNIVKRGVSGPGEPIKRYLEIGNSYHMYSGDIAVIFDIEDFTESEPTYDREKPKPFTFYADDPALASFWKKLKLSNPNIKIGDSSLKNKAPYGANRGQFDEQGNPKPEQEWGFVLAPNIVPERFKGIVMKMTRSENDKDFSVENLISLQEKIYAEKKENILPIYDANGNLHWPKQMSYEEVKKFVAERDKDKKDEK